MARAALSCSPLTAEPLDQNEAASLALMFKALGDPARLRLLSLIASRKGGEACVGEVSGALDLTQPTISHHLKVLREAGLLDSERRGTLICYRVVPSALRRLSRLIDSPDIPGAPG